MRTALHVARADVRRWRWLLLVTILLTLGQRVVDETAPILAMRQPVSGFAIDGIVLLLAMVRLVLVLVLVAVVVHETPLVGSRAFWMSRPITPVQVLAAKLLTLGVTLVVIPIIADALLLAWRGLPVGLVALLAAEGLVGWRLMGLLVLLLAAALTSSLVAYLVSLATTVLGLFTLLVVTTAIVGRSDPAPLDIMPLPSPDATELFRGWLTFVLTFIPPLLVLVLSRSRRQALVVLAVLLAISPIPGWPPVPFSLPKPPLRPPAWTTTAESLQLRIIRQRL